MARSATWSVRGDEPAESLAVVQIEFVKVIAALMRCAPAQLAGQVVRPMLLMSRDGDACLETCRCRTGCLEVVYVSRHGAAAAAADHRVLQLRFLSPAAIAGHHHLK